MKKILALDIGEKRIGIAVSDALGFMAHPLTTLKWKGPAALVSELKELLAHHDADRIVVGIPYSMKGSRSAKTDQVLEIAAQLRASLPVSVEEIDERLTTRMAERDLHAVSKKPSRHRDKIDQIAAVYILQTYLDKKKFS